MHFSYGAAALKDATVDFFLLLDIKLMNLYGLSETTGPTNVQNPFNQYNSYATGGSYNGCHMKIAKQDAEGKGEICMKGRHIMMGYLGNEKATKACIDENGYFYSGDQGMMDGKFVKITGRFKELIITAGGENVAPVPIEDNFKKVCAACSNIMMVGEGQRFMGAIITFKVDMDPKTGHATDNLFIEAKSYFKEKLGLDFTKSTEVCKSQKAFNHIQ